MFKNFSKDLTPKTSDYWKSLSNEKRSELIINELKKSRFSFSL